MNLENRVVVITGAKGGLGTFVTNAFLSAGARVVGVSRSIVAADFPHVNFSAMPAELSSGDGASTLINAVVQEHGPIHGLVHLLGGFAGGQGVADTDDATLDRMVDLNFRSAYYVVRAALRQMRVQGSGRILAVGSKAAVEPAPMAGLYAASKAALVSLIQTVAREYSGSGVTANIVLPGTMDTPANRAADPNADYSRLVDPCRVAQLMVFLLSDEASQINGAAIPIYGRQV
jgi:NAD(P)-dependent dehydrogenase (short-subunit alcohol dehydrogenase family)